jgi:Ribonuclease G/E
MERNPGSIKTSRPLLRFQEPDLIERTVRDFLTEDVERIVVDSQKAYDRMREMISRINPRSANKIKLTPSTSRSSTASTSPPVGERLLAPGPFEERRLHRH